MWIWTGVSFFVVITAPRVPRTHPADRKRNYAQARIVCPMSSRAPRAVCISHVLPGAQLQSLGIFFFHPALVFASNGLANATSVTYRSRSPFPPSSLSSTRDKFYFVDRSLTLLETESEKWFALQQWRSNGSVTYRFKPPRNSHRSRINFSE